MKQFILSLVLALLTMPLFSQIEFGVKAGVHTYDLSNLADLNISTSDFDISLTPMEARYGLQFGFYSRINFMGIFVEPSAMLHSTNVSYSLTVEDIPEAIISESFLNLDIPILAGFKILRILRIQGGPVGHMVLNSTSDLFNYDGFSQTFDKLELGVIAGVGIDLWKMRFDVLYESNVKKFADHITINGEQYNFADKAPRIIFNLGYKF